MRKFKAVYAKQYPDSQNQGQMKTSWKTLGFANEIEKEGKVTIHLTLDAIPTGTWDGEIKLFLQDEQQGGNQQQQAQSYQAPVQEYRNAQNQLTDANGQLLLDQNGQPRYN